MKLFGVGIDIIQVNRLKKSLKNKLFLVFLHLVISSSLNILDKKSLLKRKLLGVKRLKKTQIVLQKDLLQKKHFLKH